MFKEDDKKNIIEAFNNLEKALSCITDLTKENATAKIVRYNIFKKVTDTFTYIHNDYKGDIKFYGENENGVIVSASTDTPENVESCKYIGRNMENLENNFLLIEPATTEGIKIVYGSI
jgi:hypothetical protein